jgi:hypothetical protein
MAEVFFHIGMHKTATSWLQRRLFPNVEGVRLLGSKKLDEIARALETFGAQPDHAGVIVISHEGLGGTISWERTPGATYARLVENLSALMQLRPDAAVIVGYREQSRWLASAFAQRTRKDQSVTWQGYLSRFSLEELRWCNNLKLIQSLCPSVFPFLYEELAESPEIFVGDLCRFLGKSPPRNSQDLLRARENPSLRSRFGQTLWAITRPALRKSGAVARNRVRVGISHIDALFAPRQVEVPADWQIELRRDWSELLTTISALRGRDLSRFRTPEAEPAQAAVP